MMMMMMKMIMTRLTSCLTLFLKSDKINNFWKLIKKKYDDNDDNGEIDLMPQPVLGLLPLSLLLPPMSLKVAMVEDNSPAR